MSGQASSGDRHWSIVLASREVWPFVGGGGLGRYVWAASRFLANRADVSILTSTRWQKRYEELARSRDQRIPEGVRFAFVDEPEGDLSPYVSWNHAWSVRLLQGLAQLHPDGGPDILEVADYQAEGFAAAHARRGLDPRLRNTTLAVRLHTSAEMCAALNDAPEDEHMRVLSGLERFPLRFADVLLAPGGDSLDRYAQFYGEDSLAPALQSPLPMTTDLAPLGHVRGARGDGPLRLLYLNRLERRKGILELISAVRMLEGKGLVLSVVGGDTESGPGGTSMRAHAEELAAGDRRISFADRVPHEEVPNLIAEHHAVVVPTLWESFSYVVRESLACNRPVIATRAGGIVDVVRPGESGWLTASPAAEDLAATLGEVLARRSDLLRMIERRLPRRAYDRDASDQRTLEAYLELVERPRSAIAALPRRERPQERIDALILSEFGGGDPLPTLLSLEAQRGVSAHPTVVAGPSGGFPGPGPALARTASVIAAPFAGAPGTAELVLVAPAGAVFEPDFLHRAAAALAGNPSFAWVTALTYAGRKPADAPLGSYALAAADVAATAALGLVRRAALETAVGDRQEGVPADLFARLAEAGAHGLVLQEPLVTNLPLRARSLSAGTSAAG